MIKYSITPLLLVVLLLSGCGARGPGDKYLKQISSSLNKDYSLQKGELVAKYNLVNISGGNQCLFAKNYGMIVSDGDASQKFLHSIKARLSDTSILQPSSRDKIRALYNNIITINAKYNVISKQDLQKLKSFASLPALQDGTSPFDLIDQKPQTISANHFENLGYVDNTLRHIPIFLPQTSTTMTSPFGNRKHPIYSETKFHQGVDFAASKHAMVHAAADGRVLEVAHSQSYGNFIVVEHGRAFKTRYAHLSKLYTDSGTRIFQGQLIGLQGNTGAATGDHLHFEVIYRGTPVDPMFFVGREYSCRKG